MTGRIRNPWVVVAAYNEAPVVGTVVSGIRRAGYAVVVVDDGSGDRTGDVALLAGAVVVRHPINLGQGAAPARSPCDRTEWRTRPRSCTRSRRAACALSRCP